MTTYEQIVEALQGKCLPCRGRGWIMGWSKVHTCFGSTSTFDLSTTEDYFSRCDRCNGTGRIA